MPWPRGRRKLCPMTNSSSTPTTRPVRTTPRWLEWFAAAGLGCAALCPGYPIELFADDDRTTGRA